ARRALPHRASGTGRARDRAASARVRVRATRPRRMRRGRSPRGEQLADGPAREPARDVQVLAVARRAKGTAEHQDPAGSRRRAHPVMLRDEAEVAAHVLAEHPPAVHGAVDVRELRVGGEPDLPAGLTEAVAPVRLLAEEEELLVEQPYLVDGGS